MSLEQILGHLRTGEVIIVRGPTEMSPRMRLPLALVRPNAVDVNDIKSRKLLRNLITVRKGGKK
jgi:hypothetical protein